MKPTGFFHISRWDQGRSLLTSPFFPIMERASMPFTVTFFNTNQSISKVMVFILLIAFRQKQIVYSNTQY